MDTIRGVPALADTDTLASVGQYSRTLRSALTVGTPFRIAAGTTSVTTTASGAAVVTANPLPSGRFTVAPIIVCMPSFSGPVLDARIDGITTTQFRILISQGPASTTFPLMWIAIQMTDTSAGG